VSAVVEVDACGESGGVDGGVDGVVDGVVDGALTRPGVFTGRPR
jgi:hypothetical protein